MILKRHERVLAIDGDYVHVRRPVLPLSRESSFGLQIMPGQSGRAFLLDNAKTSSYHVKSIVGVQVSKNTAGTSFRLVVLRESGQKQYDFEAENGRQAGTPDSTLPLVHRMLNSLQRRSCRASNSCRGAIRRRVREEGTEASRAGAAPSSESFSSCCSLSSVCVFLRVVSVSLDAVVSCSRLLHAAERLLT